MFLPLVVVLIALQFLPELIPAHYDMNNQVTRWGSKYETLIFPVITVLFGYFMLAMAKLSSKQEENGSNNKKNVCIVTGIASLALFNAMTFYFFLYADFNSIENLSSIALDLNQLVFGLLGVAMIILGNIMPKLRMNSVVGLRSVWSMKNETAWKKKKPTLWRYFIYRKWYYYNHGMLFDERHFLFLVDNEYRSNSFDC